MKLEYAKEWYQSRIALEGDTEIGAGTPPGVRIGTLAPTRGTPLDTRIPFGTFVSLWRRNRGWDAARLAATAGLEREEIKEIERYPRSEPEPAAVYKLAGVFGLSPQPLLELAGLLEPQLSRLREEPARFAAHPESTAALTDRERETLEATLSALSEPPNESR